MHTFLIDPKECFFRQGALCESSLYPLQAQSRMNRESSTHMCTLPCVKWTSRGKLLRNDPGGGMRWGEVGEKEAWEEGDVHALIADSLC